MTEERICATCKHGEGIFCKSDDGICSSFVTRQHWEPKNPQPIQKAPSFQITEEEARKLTRAIHGGCESFGHDEDYYIKNLKQAGYIRKSELVELVEEAEKLYGGCVFYDENSVAIQKMYSAIQALKKDHPEFGGKI